MYWYTLLITSQWYWKSLLANFLVFWKSCPEIFFLNLNLTVTQCQCPATIYIKNLDQTSFPNRAVKIFSVATHLFRGIRKSLRWGTSNSMKLYKWDYVHVKIKFVLVLGRGYVYEDIFPSNYDIYLSLANGNCSINGNCSMKE